MREEEKTKKNKRAAEKDNRFEASRVEGEEEEEEKKKRDRN